MASKAKASLWSVIKEQTIETVARNAWAKFKVINEKWTDFLIPGSAEEISLESALKQFYYEEYHNTRTRQKLFHFQSLRHIHDMVMAKKEENYEEQKETLEEFMQIISVSDDIRDMIRTYERLLEQDKMLRKVAYDQKSVKRYNSLLANLKSWDKLRHDVYTINDANAIVRVIDGSTSRLIGQIAHTLQDLDKMIVHLKAKSKQFINRSHSPMWRYNEQVERAISPIPQPKKAPEVTGRQVVDMMAQTVEIKRVDNSIQADVELGEKFTRNIGVLAKSQHRNACNSPIAFKLVNRGVSPILAKSEETYRKPMHIMETREDATILKQIPRYADTGSIKSEMKNASIGTEPIAVTPKFSRALSPIHKNRTRNQAIETTRVRYVNARNSPIFMSSVSQSVNTDRFTELVRDKHKKTSTKYSQTHSVERQNKPIQVIDKKQNYGQISVSIRRSFDEADSGKLDINDLNSLRNFPVKHTELKGNKLNLIDPSIHQQKYVRKKESLSEKLTLPTLANRDYSNLVVHYPSPYLLEPYETRAQVIHDDFQRLCRTGDFQRAKQNTSWLPDYYAYAAELLLAKPATIVHFASNAQIAAQKANHALASKHPWDIARLWQLTKKYPMSPEDLIECLLIPDELMKRRIDPVYAYSLDVAGKLLTSLYGVVRSYRMLMLFENRKLYDFSVPNWSNTVNRLPIDQYW